MSESKQDLIFEKLRAHLQATRSDPVEMSAETPLFDLGVDSMGLISILFMLEEQAGIDFDRMIGTPPRTVGDLVEAAVRAMPDTAEAPSAVAS